MNDTPTSPTPSRLGPATVTVGSATHVGLVREHNEDALLTRWPVFVVADGMGGHAAGEVASALAIDTVRAALLDPVGDDPDDPDDRMPTPDAVAAAARSANAAILASARTHRERSGMGTTLTGVVAVQREDGSGAWAVVNVGDSRTYRYAEGALTQVSTDHSEVQELIDLGVLTRRDARHHPLRNLLNRSLGGHEDIEPDLFLLAPHAGELFLVCSDGLSDLVEDDDIAAVLASTPDPQAAADALVQSALDAGGIDNITVIVLQS